MSFAPLRLRRALLRLSCNQPAKKAQSARFGLSHLAAAEVHAFVDGGTGNVFRPFPRWRRRLDVCHTRFTFEPKPRMPGCEHCGPFAIID